MITIKDLKKVYSSSTGNITALEDINLKIPRSSIFGIIGLSGAGKSTLIRCINLLEKPTAGSIEIDGKDITNYQGEELRKLRSSIGMIFQHFHLLMQKNVEQNIAFPLELLNIPKKEIKARVKELLDLVDLSDKAKAYPAQLSGGQKQRVAIARTLANNPKILLCDEATSALDPLTTKSILKLLKDINQKLGLTIVLITHEMGVIRETCSHVAVIDSNRIIESGPVFDLIANPQNKESKNLIGNITSTVHFNYNIHDSGSEFNTRIKITFTGESALKPIISNIVRNFNIDINILYGNIDSIQGEPLGVLITELAANKQSVEEALNYLKNEKLNYEVL